MLKLSSEIHAKICALQPKEILVTVLEGKEICFVKIEEKPFAFLNRCPHAAAKLSEGTCNTKGIISCPLHGYKFNIQNGKDMDQNGYLLRTYKLQLIEEELFINL